jgi:threonine/homoserine/homoserine lactone efflux protein
LIFMSGVAGAAVAGAVAGLAVALPLGAIGVLLVQEAITVGRRTAAAGALGIGVIDGLYAAVAVLAGTSVSRALAGHQSLVQMVGAALLTAVAVRGLVTLRRAVREAPAQAADAARSSPMRAFSRFFTLTAVNPLTALYFVALAAGSGDTIRGLDRCSAFVAGVFVASLTWQSLLVTVGALAGARLGDRSRMATGLVGYLVVLGYAARMAAGAG